MSNLFALSPNAVPGSPSGSSVFDLPTQPQPVIPAPPDRHPTLLAETPSTLAGKPSFVVLSGGTGCNSICAAFGRTACYILPVSDDGGSSSEIIRVLGGPSIGDIRSRLIRLIPQADPGSPLDAIRTLLAYRLPASCTEREARDEWRDIVEGRSKLWAGIPSDRKEMIRAFLVHFESEILSRAHKNFSFVNGSIGNYFLSAAQAFFRSLPSAIFLFSSMTNSQANILPVIVTNHTVTIAAELGNGERLVGQCEISHPVRDAPRIDFSFESDPTSPVDPLDGTLPRARNVMFQAEEKHKFQPLSAPISRLYYINAYGNEIHPTPNPDYISALSCHDVLIYSCGSLWTSIMPCLALKGVANAIAGSRKLKAKVLLLNSVNDRETDGYTAVDYVRTIAQTLNDGHHVRSYGGLSKADTRYPISAFITHLVYLKGTAVAVDVRQITALGVRCVAVDGPIDEKTKQVQFDAACVHRAVEEILDGVAEDR
ncbi:UPF0052-domain-containing protein [Epithele typhae]|uniref:UPF0052-domain-containing protein n=1 Tax=Epithele typhae TaxID=378194 RepID=UPI0020075B08|nr:UPF0052-domain-containing protein [Epithele typhae]KAH9938994.1 UPF0052-domain-containing protein [Epithele typhae]